MNKIIRYYSDLSSDFWLDDLVIYLSMPDEFRVETVEEFKKILDSLGYCSEDFDTWEEFDDSLCDDGVYLLVSTNEKEVHIAAIMGCDLGEYLIDAFFDRGAIMKFNRNAKSVDKTTTINNIPPATVTQIPVMKLF